MGARREEVVDERREEVVDEREDVIEEERTGGKGNVFNKTFIECWLEW